jgi:hypothetical protein
MIPSRFGGIMPSPSSSVIQDRRAAALRRMRDTAKADGLAPARIAELEGALLGAFAIRDLMDVLGMRRGD